MDKRFSMGEAVSFGWETMKRNLGFFIALLIISGAISLLFNGLQEASSNGPFGIKAVIWLVSLFVETVISIGMLKVAIKFSNNEKGSFDDFFPVSFSTFFNYFFASLLYGMIILGGILLLVVPAFIWGIQFGYYGYLIVDKQTMIMDSLQKSSEITRGAKGDIFVFNILLFVINLAGVLCLFVGLFATVPTTMIASAYVYKRLRDLTGEKPFQTAGGTQLK